MITEDFTHHIEVDELTLIERAAVQRAVVTSEWIPGSVEVIGHDIYEVEESDRQAYCHKVQKKAFVFLTLKL